MIKAVQSTAFQAVVSNISGGQVTSLSGVVGLTMPKYDI